MTDKVLAQQPAPGPKHQDLFRQRDVDRLVQQALRELDQIHESGRNLPGLYYRSLVMLASRYAVVRDVQAAMQVMVLVPAAFLIGQLPGMMERDSMLSHCACLVADLLVEDGIVEPEYRHDPAAEILPGFGVA